MTPDSFTRRGMLVSSVAATFGLGGCIGSEPSADETLVETVVSIPGERVPENMAFGADGNLYLQFRK